MNRLFLFILLLCLAPAAYAKPKFVSDEITVLLRAGPSVKHKILRTLTTGAKVEVLESNGEYEHVRTGDGVDGWILSRHLTASTVAKHQLTKANHKIDTLENKIKEMKEELEQIRASYNRLTTEHHELDKTKTSMEAELEQIRTVAAQPLKLSQEKKELTAQTENLTDQVGTLKSELDKLRNNSQKQWFLTGAAVVLLGVLIGLTIPKMRRHRRSDWGSAL